MADEKQNDWFPTLRGLVNPEVERAIHLILEQGYASGRFIRTIAATRPTREEITKQLVSPAVIQGVLQAPGSAPLNVNNLPGVLAQPQKTFIPLVTSLPIPADPLSQDGTLIRYNGIVWYYDATVEPGTWRPLGVLGVVLQDTYALLQDGTTYPASFYPVGTLFWTTDRKQLYLNKLVGGVNVWTLILMLPMSDVHSGRYAVGTVNTAGTAVAWVSGATFNTNWAGRRIIINNVRYTVASVTNSTNLVLSSTAGIQAGVTYYCGFFSVDLAAGVQFFETDRQFLYQAATASGTVTPNGTTIDWTSGDTFSPTWVGSTIVINGANHTVATVVSSIQLTVTVTAGTPGAVVFSVESGKWLWVSGQGASTQATLPTDLITTDAGALWAVTDYMHLLQWSGSAWTYSESDAGSGYIVMGTSAGAPTNGLWGACDGSVYAVLQANGTTSNITSPNLTGEVFIKGAAAFAAQQAAVRATWEAAAVTDNASAGTPAGTVSAPTFTGDPVAAASTNATPDLVAPDVTGTGVSPVTTATGTVSAPTFTGSALGNHQHALSDANAQLKVPSEANGGLPLRISCVFYLRR